MESLVQALPDSHPASYSSKATQTDVIQTTTGDSPVTTQTDALQMSKDYDSEATQTKAVDALTPKEGYKKVEDPSVQLPMFQQSPRDSCTDQTDIPQSVPVQHVSESIRGFPEFGQEISPRLLEASSKGTLPGVSFTTGRVQTGSPGGQDLAVPILL